MEIKADTQIEVTEKQYRKLMTVLAGVVAGRETDDGKFYVKVWDMRCVGYVKQILIS